MHTLPVLFILMNITFRPNAKTVFYIKSPNIYLKISQRLKRTLNRTRLEWFRRNSHLASESRWRFLTCTPPALRTQSYSGMRTDSSRNPPAGWDPYISLSNEPETLLFNKIPLASTFPRQTESRLGHFPKSGAHFCLLPLYNPL